MAAGQNSQKQETSFLADLLTRPRRYWHDLTNQGAFRFALGNTAFAAFLGSTLGINFNNAAGPSIDLGAASGPLLATGIQGAITAMTGLQQMKATYNGGNFGTPFHTQGV